MFEGDKLEFKNVDGLIALAPVAVYPKEYINKLENEISVLKKKRKYSLR